MTAEIIHIGNALQILASITVLVWFFYGPWRSFVIDLTRQNLFELRDEVFMLAVDGRIPFDHSAYKVFRNRLNAMIRFCEHYSFTAFIAAPADHNENPPSIFDSLNGLEDDLAKEIRRRYHMAMAILVASMVSRSLFWTIVLMVSFPFFALVEMLRGVQHARRLAVNVERRIDRDVSSASLA